MNRVKLVRFVWGSVILCTVGLAQTWNQETLQVRRIGKLPIDITSTERIAFFSRMQDRDLVVVSPKVGTTGSQSALFSISQDGSKKVLLQGPIVVKSMASNGSQIFIPLESLHGLVGQLMDVNTGESRRMEFDGVIHSAALSPDRLAVLTAKLGQTNGSDLTIYDVESLRVLEKRRIDIQPWFTKLLFTSPQRLLMVEADTARVLSVNLDGSFAVSPAVQLSGSEVNCSLDYVRSNARGVVGSRPGFVRSMAIGAHVSTASGSDAFFVYPSRRGEGRLVEFDSQGRQIGLYLLEQDRRESTVGLHFDRTSTGADTITWANSDGMLDSAKRP